MSNPDVELRKLMRRVDLYAARLNPGLFAVAVTLSTFLLGEMTVRFPALYEQEIASAVLLSVDPTALLPVDVPLSD